MSITDDVESTEVVGEIGDIYILRKKGTNIYGMMHHDQFLELGVKYMETMREIHDELYGPFINDLWLLARISPEVIIKAAKDKNWSIEEDSVKASMLLLKKFSQDDGVMITVAPPLTAPDFLDYYGEGSISIHYASIHSAKGIREIRMIHAKNTPEEKLSDITLNLKELIKLAKKYAELC